MRKFEIAYRNELDEDCVEVVEESWIRERYWPWWYSRMCASLGKEAVDRDFTFEHCLEDWVVTHWAIKIV